jgi:hypothetical protein
MVPKINEIPKLFMKLIILGHIIPFASISSTKLIDPDGSF